VLDLPPHSENHENKPVYDQDGPEYRKIGKFSPGACKGDTDGAGCTVPEFELGKSAYERLELIG